MAFLFTVVTVYTIKKGIFLYLFLFTNCIHIVFNKLKQTMALIKKSKKVISFRPTKEQRDKLNKVAELRKLKSIPALMNHLITGASLVYFK